MRPARFIGFFSFVAGVLMFICGASAWGATSTQLASENITAANDAPAFAGLKVAGPLTAFYQAEAAKQHTRTVSNGLTYAELVAKVQEAKDADGTATTEQLQTTRTMVEIGNFVRASLLTSVVAFEVSALVMGADLLFSCLGWGLYRPSAVHAQDTEPRED